LVRLIFFCFFSDEASQSHPPGAARPPRALERSYLIDGKGFARARRRHTAQSARETARAAAGDEQNSNEHKYGALTAQKNPYSGLTISEKISAGERSTLNPTSS
jgi:hypothetical protein